MTDYDGPHRCPYCGARHDAAMFTTGDKDAPPVAGDVSICAMCAGIGIFTGVGNEVREPSPAELARLLESLEVTNVAGALRLWIEEGRP